MDFRCERPIATVILDRPDSDNRIDLAMAAELRDVCRAVGEDDGIRVVIITSKGSSFSVGREEFPAELIPGSSKAVQRWLCQIQVASSVSCLQIPVIAAINGEALDHGLELALAADLRVAAEDAQFGFTDLSRGAFPWDGGTQRLPRLVGPAWARDMIFTGRIIKAPLALKIGLLNQVTRNGEVLDQARQLAENIAASAPTAARYAKEAIKSGMELTLAQGLRLEADLNILLHSTSDRAEGIGSFLERRQPEFKDE